MCAKFISRKYYEIIHTVVHTNINRKLEFRDLERRRARSEYILRGYGRHGSI